MTKMVQVRVVVPIDDGITTQQLTTLLRERLRTYGNEKVSGDGDGENLPGVVVGLTVFWSAADVRRGSETRSRKTEKE